MQGHLMRHRHIHRRANDGEIKVCMWFDDDDAAIEVPLALLQRPVLFKPAVFLGT